MTIFNDCGSTGQYHQQRLIFEPETFGSLYDFACRKQVPLSSPIFLRFSTRLLVPFGTVYLFIVNHRFSALPFRSQFFACDYFKSVYKLSTA